MKFSASSPGDEFARQIGEVKTVMAQAATSAVKEAAGIAVREGRSDIGAAGFGTRWQTGFDAKVFPQNGASLNASARISLKPAFAGIFEEGGTIRGAPLLWVPLAAVPLGSGGRRLSAGQYARQVGPLVSVNRPGKRPLLVAKRRRRERGPMIPLFVGVPSVTIRKRFHLTSIIQRAADKLPAFYEKNLKII